jgi:hypothetical protein
MYQVWDYDIFLFDCNEDEVTFFEDQGFQVVKVA